MEFGRVTLRDIKSRSDDVRDRIVDLCPRGIDALRSIHAGQTSGPVFVRADGEPWHPDVRVSGAQLNRAFQAAAKEAGVNRRVFLHMIRHSWASWHYCVHRDLKKLKEDGAWESLDMADRYSHLAPPGMAADILAFWETRSSQTDGELGNREMAHNP